MSFPIYMSCGDRCLGLLTKSTILRNTCTKYCYAFLSDKCFRNYLYYRMAEMPAVFGKNLFVYKNLIICVQLISKHDIIHVDRTLDSRLHLTYYTQQKICQTLSMTTTQAYRRSLLFCILSLPW